MSTEFDGEFDEGPDALLDALVRGERAAMKPPEGAQGQTWERVAATVAIGGPPPLEPASITGAGSAAAAPWTKIVLGLLLGVAVVGGYRLATTPDDPEPRVGMQTRAADDTPEPSLVPAAQPRAEPPPSAPAFEPEPEPEADTETEPEPVRREVAKAKASPSVREAPTSDLAEETRLLARARRRLGAASPRDALAPLREHARRFPNGQLTEDRMVLQAQALCESGQADAGRKQAAALRKAFPSSSHLPRVDRACAS